jgi:hypothetical protein
MQRQNGTVGAARWRGAMARSPKAKQSHETMFNRARGQPCLCGQGVDSRELANPLWCRGVSNAWLSLVGIRQCLLDCAHSSANRIGSFVAI